MKPIISFRVTQDGELNVRNPSLVIRNIQRDSSGSITYDRTTIFASDDLNQTLQSPSDATKTISFTVTGSTQYKQNEIIIVSYTISAIDLLTYSAEGIPNELTNESLTI